MLITEKLDMLDLNEEEKVKAIEKFSATFGILTDEEYKEAVEYLKSQGILITKAKNVKVISNCRENIVKKINIIGDIHETDIYRQDPSKLSYNEDLKLYQRIQRCKQTGIQYKKEDGTYEKFLFDEKEWQQVNSKEKEPIIAPPTFTTVEPEIQALEPNDNKIVDMQDFMVEDNEIKGLEPDNIDFKFEEVAEVQPPIDADNKYIDIKDYMAADNDMEDLEAKTTNFATIRKELEGQLAELDALRNDPDFGDEISFADLEPESYGMGRAA